MIGDTADEQPQWLCKICKIIVDASDHFDEIGEQIRLKN